MPLVPPPVDDPTPDPGDPPDLPSDTADTGSSSPATPADGPDWDLPQTALYINLGDSVAAGYDAAGEYGYARLLHANDDLLAPGYAGADLLSLSGAELMNIAESGATSGDILSNLRGTNLPQVSGEVVVTISAGGNDFNDDPLIMLTPALTEAVAAQVRTNLGAMVDELRQTYGDPHIYVLDIQDPTLGHHHMRRLLWWHWTGEWH